MFKKGDTNFAFTPGKLTTLLDAQAGSSGKGAVASFICKHADNYQFACCTFSPQAGHTIVDDGKTYFYQTFNSCAYQHGQYEKLYLGPGCIIELPAFFREIEESSIPHEKIGISPIAGILLDQDGAFERGEVDLDGNPKKHSGTMKTGTTAHGAGVARARRTLRRPEARYARDVPELKQYLCDVPQEIMTRLERGQAGLLEVAQGFQLSYLLPEFFPHTTSRNCTVAAGFDDMMLPVIYAGNVILNYRTYPIRINSKKFICKKTGKHLTWPEVEEMKAENKRIWDQYTAEGRNQHAGDLCGPELPFRTIDSFSGPGYPDQEELTWEQITEISGSKTPIMEITSVTKLPRRIFTFSRQNLEQSIRHNRTGGRMILSINFMNYTDADLFGKPAKLTSTAALRVMSTAANDWLKANFGEHRDGVNIIGTGPDTDHKILIT